LFSSSSFGFDDPANTPAWYSLGKRKSTEDVSGEVSIRLGFVGDLNTVNELGEQLGGLKLNGIC